MVPKEAPLIVLDSKSAMCMAKNSRDTKHTRHIARRIHFVRNGEDPIGAYIIFYQGGPIDHGTHVPGPVAQSSAEIEYNAACTAGMA